MTSTVTDAEFADLVADIKRQHYHLSPLTTKAARALCRAWARDHDTPCDRGMIPWETYIRYVLSLDRGVAHYYDELDSSVRVLCPNCGNLHLHGKGPGHRVSHCTVSVIEPDQGYVVTYPGGVSE